MKREYVVWGPNETIIIPYSNIIAWDYDIITLTGNNTVRFSRWKQITTETSLSETSFEKRKSAWHKERQLYRDWLDKQTPLMFNETSEG